MPTVLASDNALSLLPEVVRRRSAFAGTVRETVARLRGPALEPGDPERPIDVAVLNHVMLQLRLAAAERDQAAAHAAIDAWTRSARWRTRDTVLIDSADCVSRPMPGLDEPVRCVGADTRPAADGDLAATLEAVAAAGFGPLVAKATGVVVRLAAPEPGTSTISYTLAFLPGTAHIGWPEHPADRGESLVHESAHSWLNECLGRAAQEFPTEPLLHSPWRGVLRPPLGLLHAAFAFSTVACYLAAYPWPAPMAAERRERVAAECALLRANMATIDRVVAMVPDAEVARMVRDQVGLAMACG